MSKITKHDIAKKVMGIKPNLKLSNAMKIVRHLFDYVGDEIAAGKRFPILNVGRIAASRKAPRPGRNPKTGEDHTIKSQLAITLSKQGKKDNQKLSIKDDFLNSLRSKFDLSLNESKEIHNILISTISSVGEGISTMEIRDFGVFSPRLRKERTARNPKTGEQINLASKFVIHFKASDLIKQKAINSGLFGSFE